MNRIAKAITVAAIHAALVASLGAKLLYDRSTRPRVWVRTAPYDPSTPIRGRYVSLQLVVEPRGVTGNSPVGVTLHVESEQLIAEANESRRYSPSDLHVSVVQRAGETLSLLDQPVAFFIPEHIVDPSRRPAGEQLWVEATIPKKGPPRPIRLGVKKEGGQIEPLDIDEAIPI